MSRLEVIPDLITNRAFAPAEPKGQKIMKKNSIVFLGVAAVVLATAAVATAQEKLPTFEMELPARVMLQAGQNPGKGPGTDGNTFTFVTSEFSFDKLVKGAPYSAQAVTETTQTLSDGNRIVNTSSSTVYRDGEGRTRREQTLKVIGHFSASGEPSKTISINDPVAGVSYVLNPGSHLARKIQGFRMETTSAGALKTSASGGEGATFTFNRTAAGEMKLQQGAVEAKIRDSKDGPTFRKEELGTQTVEGVSAIGTRTTKTIPAGEIGNERAIEIVDERWYSPELQAMVMTRHADPRSGETVYRLTNINRAEPDRSLFEIPAGYSLKEDSAPMKFRTTKPDKPEQQ
jgi:hypothetical protein